MKYLNEELIFSFFLALIASPLFVCFSIGAWLLCFAVLKRVVEVLL